MATLPAGAMLDPAIRSSKATWARSSTTSAGAASSRPSVEGGATVAGGFHRAGLVDRYVLDPAPALAGGDDGRPLFVGPSPSMIGDLWRARIVSVDRLGDDSGLQVECSTA